jgi:NodT family efflux transporter outer membrane factor (OMF) lipoprotein
VSALLVLLLAGCAVGPDYVPPDVPSPGEWSTELQGGLTTERPDSRALADWWTTLNDPVLTSLIERAIEGNLDLREAVARIREARARRGISKADLFPSVDAAGSRTRSRSSEATGGGTERNFYSTGFDAAWELDVFGGVRRSVEAADADLDASEENLHDVLVTLLAEVALNYVDMRTFQARLSIAEANLDAQEETYGLVTARFEAGLTSQLDLEQARYNLENTRAQIPTLKTGLDRAKNRLAVLLGKSPGAVGVELSEREPIPVTPIEIAVGVPADTLRQRPDVRRAERQLAAQTARIGVATAELYPKFTLSGSIGLDSPSFDTLFRTGSRTFRYGPSFSWRVFEAGRIRQNIEVQNALQEQLLTRYEATILAALEEVENALIAYASEQSRRGHLIKASQAAQIAADLAETQYSSGLIDFQTVLDAQRSLLSLQDQLSVSEGEVTSDLIRLYKALGGGWTSLASDTEE